MRSQKRRVTLIRRPLILSLAAVLVLAIAGVAAAATGLVAKVSPHYVSLKAVGVSASKATVEGRNLSVRVKFKRKVTVRFSVQNSKGQTAWNGPNNLRRGTYTLTKRLNRTPRGSNLRLRITADDGRKRGRGSIALRVIKPPAPKPPVPPVPPAPPVHVNSAPTALGLSDAEVDENLPAGTTVGTFSGTDPDAADTLSFALATGAGDADNGSFSVDGAALKTAEEFDIETKSSYSMRARVSDGNGGTFERQFTITVTDANDVPVVTTSAGSLAYMEDDPANAVDPGLAVSDADDTNVEGATVSVSGGFEPDDELSFTNQNGITGSYNAGTGVLTLSGTSSVADYRTALRSVGYRNTGDNPATSKSVEFKVRDGEAESAPATKAIALTRVNDAPVVNTTSADLAYAENDGPVAVDAGLAVTDPDNTLLAGATVAVTSNFSTAQDELAFTDQLGITGVYNDATGTLTLSGSATVADYRTALRSVTYENSADDPSPATRTITFTATDPAAATSAPATRGITITPADDAPVVETSNGSLAYTEGDVPTVLDPGVTVTDADDANLEDATVSIASGFDPGDDLQFTDQNGISGSYNSGTGVLTLSGSATVADYQTALRSIEFHQTDDNPTTSKSVQFVVNDGDADSAGATGLRAITVTRVNDVPVLDTTNAALAYSEGAGPVAADPDVTVSDPDSTQLSGASVQITTNFVAAQDELAFATQFGITGTYDDTTGTLSLAGVASLASYEAALRAVTYENRADDPSPPTRTLSFQAIDAEGGTSIAATRGVTLGTANDSATVTTTGTALAYTEGDPAVPVDTGLTVSDPDDLNLEGAKVQITGGLESDDDLLFTDQLGITGSYSSGTGVLTLLGSSSVANYETALRSVRFRNTGDDPALVKTVAFRADDGDGLGPAATRNIDVTRVNDAPVLTTSGGSATFTEGGGAVAIDPGLGVADPDSASLSGATVSISSNFSSLQDSLGFIDQLGISGIYNSGTGVLTLSGAASKADYQTALRTVSYDNSSDAASPATRTISFQVTDSSAAASNTATRGVSIGGVNDAPVVTTTGGPAAYTENAASVQADGGLTVADVDSANLGSAQVRISAGFDTGDSLTFTPVGSISGVYNGGTGVLTMSGSDTVADYQTALLSVRFSSTNDNPALSKTIEFKVNDGSLDSNLATKAIAVTRVNDAPILATSLTDLPYTENGGQVSIDPGLTVTDPDSTQLSEATVTIQNNFSSLQDDLAFTDGPQITGLYNDTTGVLTLSGTASVATYQAALRSVTYANASDAPAPLARTIAFQAFDDVSAPSNVATRNISITATNDPPTAVDDTGTTDEDTTLSVSAPGVLGNDTDVDPGDSKTVVRLNGSLTLTGTSVKGAAVTITANGSYTYDPGAIFQGLSTGQSDTDSFTYRMSDSGGAESTATVNLTINGVSDAPTAAADTFNAIGNTGLYVGTTRPASQAGKEISGSVLTNDTDPDTAQSSLVAEPVTDAPTTLGGTITIEADGNFSYQPDDGDTGVNDTFTYRVCDASPCNSGTVANSTGTLNLPIAGQVWYVQNNSAAGGDGTSDGPFDTLVEAETASGTGDSVFVFDGDNTSTNLNSGYAMENSERLIGEVSGLSLDPDGGGPLTTQVLHPGTAGASPTLTTTTAEDVVSLAATTTLDGFDVDPGGSGGGIGGGAGAGGGAASDVTIAHVNVIDTGTAGTQPGLDLNGTTGVNDVSNLVVSNGGSAGAIGVRLNNAGTVNFASAGTIKITTAGAKGLDATGTSMGTGSVFDEITVTGSGSGGVSMATTTGTTGLGDGSGTDLALTTTSGAAAALSLNNAGTVTVDSAGSDSVSATGGPAVDVTSTTNPSLNFDTVSSTNSSTDGINIDTIGTGTFSATGGTIAGATGISFDLNSGSGAITYDGALNDGTGKTADVTGRTGGIVSFGGSIADTADSGGGITLLGNTGGSTTFSGASKVINSQGVDAVNMDTSDGHNLSFSGGGLDIDTTTGSGIKATTSGSVQVSGSGNTIATTTGTPLSLVNTDIGTAADATFESISSNGAVNGILLNNTGPGSLTVTSTGSGGCTTPATCTGGAIQNSTGPGISLTTVGGGASLTRMSVNNGADDGIRATSVSNGLSLIVSRVVANGDAVGERGLDYTNVTGNSSIINSAITGSAETNARIANDVAGTDTLAISGTAFSNNSTTLGAHGLEIRGDGTATINATISGNTLSGNRDNAFTLSNGGGSPTMNVHFNSNAITGGNAGAVSGQPGISISPTADAQTKVELNLNSINGMLGRALIVNPLPGSTAASQFDATVTSNNIGNGTAFSGSAGGEGIMARAGGNGDSRFAIRNNIIRNYAQIGMWLRAQEGSGGTGNADFTVTGNTVINPDGVGFEGIYVSSGATSGDNASVCADIGGAGALANAFSTAGSGGVDDIGFSKRFATDIRLPGFTTGGDLTTYIQSRNSGGPTVVNYDNPLTGQGGACAQATSPP